MFLCFFSQCSAVNHAEARQCQKTGYMGSLSPEWTTRNRIRSREISRYFRYNACIGGTNILHSRLDLHATLTSLCQVHVQIKQDMVPRCWQSIWPTQQPFHGPRNLLMNTWFLFDHLYRFPTRGQDQSKSQNLKKSQNRDQSNLFLYLSRAGQVVSFLSFSTAVARSSSSHSWLPPGSSRLLADVWAYFPGRVQEFSPLYAL